MTIEQKVAKIRAMSNEELIRTANRAPDFGWDDEGAEIEKRMNSGVLKCEMQGNRIVIID